VLRDESSAVLRDESSAVLWDESRAVLRDESRAELWDESRAVLRYESSAVLRDESSAVLRDESSAVLARWSVARVLSPRARTSGAGTVINTPPIDSPSRWLDYHGVPVTDGAAIIYKAVDNDWHASHHIPGGTMPDYSPGSTPLAPDFDPSPRDCGAGLHGCASPSGCLKYHDGTRFVAIKVKVADMGAPDPAGDTGKIRFRTGEVLYECNIDGERV
jgi:hypothetical protein